MPEDKTTKPADPAAEAAPAVDVDTALAEAGAVVTDGDSAETPDEGAAPVDLQAEVEELKAQNAALTERLEALEAAPTASVTDVQDAPAAVYRGDFIPEGTPEHKAFAKTADAGQMPDFVPAGFDCPDCDYVGKSAKGLETHRQKMHKA